MNASGADYRATNAFEVTGDDVHKARRRTQGNYQAWDITVRPDSYGPVTISLPQTTACDASGTICTA